MRNPSKPRNGMIDLMKFLFTILTVIFHSFKAFPGGYIAVEFFFIVSGYLMAKSSEKRILRAAPIGRDTFSFMLQKAGGIFPFYIVAWVLCFIIHHVLRNTATSDILMELFRSPYNIFMLGMSGPYKMGYSIGGSWYISAMLLAMLVLYPLRRKKPEFFDYVIAPVITLLFVGYIYHLGSGISRTITYIPDLHILDGLFRAIAEISLGCFCYRMGTRLMQVNFTWIGQLLLSIIELGGYLLVGFTVWEHSGSDKDLVLLVILAVCVTLSFSGKGIHARLCTNRLFPFLGQFSLSIYLSHGVVVNVIVPYLYKQNLPEYISKTSKTAYFTLYLGITLLLSIVYYLIGTLVQKTFPKIKQSLKKLLIKQA